MTEPTKILIIILFGIDMFLTYWNVSRYKKLFPKRDFSTIEMNPIPRYFWKKFGLKKGGIIAIILQSLILVLLVLNFNRDTLLILIGVYFMVILTHLDTNGLIRKKLHPEKQNENWRKYAIALLLILSVIDITLTFVYLNQYHNWQPDKAFNQMESNPLLLFLINILGLNFGLVIGSIIIWSLLVLIGKKGAWYVVVPVAFVLIFASIITLIHLNMLHELMDKFPIN